MHEHIQFDTSSTKIGGINVTNAIQCNDKLTYNESYTVLGSLLKAPCVYACYDLTVIGNVEVEELEVKGNLSIIGNITAKRVTCNKAIICSGDMNVKQIACDEIIASNIKCHSLSCDGNVIVRSVIDVEESIVADKSVISGEGIIGGGEFYAENALAVEYFEFDGNIIGKVLDLENSTSLKEECKNKGADKKKLEAEFSKLRKEISTILSKAGKVDEDKLIQAVAGISSLDDRLFSDWDKLTSKLVELSYVNTINNFRDYLYVVMASKLLPKEIKEYETLKPLFSEALTEAKQKLDSLEFHAESIDDVAYALKIVNLCEIELNINKEDAYDKILQAMGIKYKTAMKYLK